MNYIKSAMTLLIFLFTLIYLPGYEWFFFHLIYVGIAAPILLQKIWVGTYFPSLDKNTLGENMLFSYAFIVSSLVFVDVMLTMKMVIDLHDDGYTNYILLAVLFVLNRCSFLYSMFYLWNKQQFAEKKKIYALVFRIIRAFYVLVAIPVSVVALWIFGSYVILSLATMGI